MMKSICVVGGGSAGLTSAMILKSRFPTMKVKIIKSDKIGIIGVGEASTEHWSYFLQFCSLDYLECLRETGATFKYGVLFKDWMKHDYFNNLNSLITDTQAGQYSIAMAYTIAYDLKPEEYTDSLALQNKVYFQSVPTNQFNFNTFKLNEWLLKKCVERGIEIVDDDIEDIVVKDNKIIKLKGRQEHVADFFVDCTGFKRLLISKLGAKWQSYKEYLPMNEAIAFPTKDTDEYPPYVTARAMKAGWMWRTPVRGRWGNGYVFDNRYINAEEAQKECEEYLGHKIKIASNIKFDAGSLDKPWQGNCIALGLSSSFVEPLEATSIGFGINQCFLFIHMLLNYDQHIIDDYNEDFQYLIENVRDYVIIHYMVDKKDSPFWKELKLNLPDSLKKNLAIWKNRLPMQIDFKSKYCLFYPNNYSLILKEIGFFDKQKIKEEYEMLPKELKKWCESKMKFQKQRLNDRSMWISHKSFLESLTNESN